MAKINLTSECSIWNVKPIRSHDANEHVLLFTERPRIQANAATKDFEAFRGDISFRGLTKWPCEQELGYFYINLEPWRLHASNWATLASITIAGCRTSNSEFIYTVVYLTFRSFSSSSCRLGGRARRHWCVFPASRVTNVATNTFYEEKYTKERGTLSSLPDYWFVQKCGDNWC